MKKTLVIHPRDNTTRMLELVYRNHPEYTVCRDDGISKQALKELIQQHDRIIMLGHGTDYGLINSARTGYLIDDSFADILKTKETYSVWCYSKQYFEKHNMHGFHTDMIISEVAEEYYILGEEVLDEDEIYKNMIKFSEYLNDCIELEPNEMKEYMLEHYVGEDKVTQYNREHICVI